VKRDDVPVERNAEESPSEVIAREVFTMLDDHLVLPFATTVIGTPAVVRRVDIDDQDVIVAICQVGRRRQRLPIHALPLPSPPPDGAEWIEAYRHWMSGHQRR
jgi:hypothetical protein